MLGELGAEGTLPLTSLLVDGVGVAEAGVVGWTSMEGVPGIVQSLVSSRVELPEQALERNATVVNPATVASAVFGARTQRETLPVNVERETLSTFKR